MQGGVAWRFPVAFQGFFIILLAILLLFTPESPRWLIYHGRTEDATRIISRLKNKEVDHAEVRQQVAEIEDAVQLEQFSKVGSWKDLFKRDAIRSRRRLAIACAIQAFQQLNGINAVIYYSNTLFPKRRLFKPRIRPHGRVPSDMVLCGFIHTVVPDRSVRSSAALDILRGRNGNRNGSSSSVDIPSAKSDISSIRRRDRRSSYAIPVRGTIHHRLPSYCMGIPIRDTSIGNSTKGFIS